MKIEAIEVYYVVLPLISPWRTAYGDDADIHTILIKMISGSDIGWGETSPLAVPTYSPEYAMSAYYLISEIFAPLLVGKDIPSSEELLDRIKHYKGNPFAKGGIEWAWWILKANVDKQPLHSLLGGKTRNIDAGADFGIQDSYEALIEKIQSALDRGFKRVKLKVRPGWDLDMLKIVRKVFPDLTMHIDCNAGYTLDDIDFFKNIDHLNLAMIEQPLNHTDLFEHAYLQKKLHTPICLDESIKSIKDFQLALNLKSCRVLNIKYSRVGGLSIAVKLHNMAQEAGVSCWVGGMLESAIGSGINIELATLPNFTYPGDIFESQRFYHCDISDPEVVMNPDCTFSPSSVPGIPYKPSLEKISHTVKDMVIIEQ